eukprot:scaffold55877_cov26-Tisochrysis_lutea.AAC.3
MKMRGNEQLPAAHSTPRPVRPLTRRLILTFLLGALTWSLLLPNSETRAARHSLSLNLSRSAQRATDLLIASASGRMPPGLIESRCSWSGRLITPRPVSRGAFPPFTVYNAKYSPPSRALGYHDTRRGCNLTLNENARTGTADLI